MSEKYDSLKKLDRRTFLRLMAGGAFGLAGGGSLLALAGCGGGGGGTSAPSGVSISDVKGVVTQTEIGGQSLQISSSYGLASVGANGNFTIGVSKNGAHLLTAFDASKNARGLCISVPNMGTPSLAINATSTAIALIFRSPGILCNDPSMAAGRCANIATLPSFPVLVGFLRAQLPAQTLTQLISSGQLTAYIQACVKDWVDTNGRSEHRLIDISPVNKTELYFTVENSDNISPATIKLENYAWRCVRVYRRDMSDGVEKLHVTVNDGNNDIMGGATPISWGNIFSFLNTSVGNPYVRLDHPNLSSNSGITSSQYWIVGLGASSGSESLPSSLDGSLVDPIGVTLLSYIIFPIISIFLGLGTDSVEWIHTASAVWDIMKLDINMGQVLKDLTSIDIMSPAFADAVKETVVSIMQILIKSRILYTYGLITSFMQGALEVILKYGSIEIGVGNLYAAILSWINHPRCVHADVKLTGGTAIIIS